MKLIQIIKANMVFSISPYDFYKSIWIGPLLITWCMESATRSWYKTIDFSWYGWNYWMSHEVEL